MVTMRSGGSNGSGGQLPSLEYESNGHHHGPTSASLRGAAHNKVPEIANQPLHTLLPILPDGEEHPEPYYITQNVV